MTWSLVWQILVLVTGCSLVVGMVTDILIDSYWKGKNRK